jgi:VanZ family protein
VPHQANFLAPLPGKKKISAKGVSHAHPLLYFSFSLLYFCLHRFIKNTKKIVSFIVVFTCQLLVLLE